MAVESRSVEQGPDLIPGILSIHLCGLGQHRSSWLLLRPTIQPMGTRDHTLECVDSRAHLVAVISLLSWLSFCSQCQGSSAFLSISLAPHFTFRVSALQVILKNK